MNFKGGERGKRQRTFILIGGERSEGQRTFILMGGERGEGALLIKFLEFLKVVKVQIKEA